jgi:phospholipase A1
MAHPGDRRAAALLLAAVPALAAAQGADSAVSCHALKVDSERLACYDRLTGRAAKEVPTPAPAASTTPADAQARETARTDPAAKPPSMLDAAWSFDPASPRYDIGYYHENYFLVGRYTDNVNLGPFLPLFEAAGNDPNLNHTEAKFQLSFKGRLWTTDDRRFGVWAAYTQQSQWQVYNGDESRPFRETNYMPELFVSYRPDIALPGGFRFGVLNAGFNHQSNGRSDALSRSWDRLFVEGGVEKGNFALYGKLWYRLSEDEGDDDNPDITDYYGYGGIRALYRYNDNSFAAMLRGNVRTGKGAFQASWMSPRIPFLGPLRAYVQFFTGYGESLIDYNWKQTTIGAGFALNDGL